MGRMRDTLARAAVAAGTLAAITGAYAAPAVAEETLEAELDTTGVVEVVDAGDTGSASEAGDAGAASDAADVAGDDATSTVADESVVGGDASSDETEEDATDVRGDAAGETVGGTTTAAVTVTGETTDDDSDTTTTDTATTTSSSVAVTDATTTEDTTSPAAMTLSANKLSAKKLSTAKLTMSADTATSATTLSSAAVTDASSANSTGTDLSIQAETDSRDNSADTAEFYKFLSDYDFPEAYASILDEYVSGDSELDLRSFTVGGNTYTLVTAAKDQAGHGICWCFANTGAVESAYLLCVANMTEDGLDVSYLHDSESLDLSEQQVLYFTYAAINAASTFNGRLVDATQVGEGTNRNYGDGGFAFNFVQTVTSWMGVTTEDVAPYFQRYGNLENVSESLRDASIVRVTGAYILPELMNTGEIYYTDLDGNPISSPKDSPKDYTWHLPRTLNEFSLQAVKAAIQKYGAVSVQLYADDGDSQSRNAAGFNWVTGAYYSGDNCYETFTSGKKTAANVADHLVLIAGYDDNYAKENFSVGNQPPGDGAFLVKNSWASFGKMVTYQDYYDGVLTGKLVETWLKTMAQERHSAEDYVASPLYNRYTYNGRDVVLVQYGKKVGKDTTTLTALGEDGLDYVLYDMYDFETGKLVASDILWANSAGYLKGAVELTSMAGDAYTIYGYPQNPDSPTWDGYYWVSYYEPSVMSLTAYEVELPNADGNYTADYKYQYDYLGLASDVVVKSNAFARADEAGNYQGGMVANVFTAEEDEELVQVSVVTRTPLSGFTIRIYLLDEGAEGPEDGECVLEYTVPYGVAWSDEWNTDVNLFGGYHTVNLPESVFLKEGQRFSVVEWILSPTEDGGYYVYSPIEASSGTFGGSNEYMAALVEGQSYVYTTLEVNGEEVTGWFDLYWLQQNGYLTSDLFDYVSNNKLAVGNVMIRAFTVSAAGEATDEGPAGPERVRLGAAPVRAAAPTSDALPAAGDATSTVAGVAALAGAAVLAGAVLGRRRRQRS